MAEGDSDVVGRGKPWSPRAWLRCFHFVTVQCETKPVPSTIDFARTWRGIPRDQLSPLGKGVFVETISLGTGDPLKLEGRRVTGLQNGFERLDGGTAKPLSVQLAVRSVKAVPFRMESHHS
jgi:hypothetical protein